jgi:hypothetical protein
VSIVFSLGFLSSLFSLTIELGPARLIALHSPPDGYVCPRACCSRVPSTQVGSWTSKPCACSCAWLIVFHNFFLFPCAPSAWRLGVSVLLSRVTSAQFNPLAATISCCTSMCTAWWQCDTLTGDVGPAQPIGFPNLCWEFHVHRLGVNVLPSRVASSHLFLNSLF